MSSAKHQRYAPAGIYQINPPVVKHQVNPPIGMYQTLPAVYTMAVTEPQQTYEAFDRKKAYGTSIALIIFGGLQFILNLIALNFLFVIGNAIPIVAGALGIISSKQPSNGKILAFMILSIITVVVSIISAIACIFLILFGSILQGYSDDSESYVVTIIFVAGIFGVIFNVVQTVASIYCSILAGRQVDCCGGSTQNQQFQGVVHGQIHQTVPNAGQYQPIQLPASPPSYSQATQ